MFVQARRHMVILVLQLFFTVLQVFDTLKVLKFTSPIAFSQYGLKIHKMLQICSNIYNILCYENVPRKFHLFPE
jgi:hypothetical protein